MALFPFEKYLIARGALMAVTAWIPACILFFCALCLTRRRKDPARTAFTYLKLALLVFAAYAFFEVCTSALIVAGVRARNDGYYYDSYDAITAIAITSASTGVISNLFDKIVDILVMIMLLRISTGIVIAQSGHAGPIGKILRFGSYAFGALLAILTIAVLGLQIRFVAAFYGDGYYDGDGAQGEDEYNKARQIDFSFRVLVFVAALGIVARSVMVKMQPKAEKTLTWCSTMLIAMSIAWLLRTTYTMASIAAWSDLENSRRDRYESYYNILDVVFGVWPQITVLCMVFALGTAKNNGLWSTPQPFNAPQGNQQTAWGYNYNNGPQPTAPPMVQQQPQFQQPQQQFQQPPQQQYQQPQQQQYQQPQQQQYQQPYQQPQPVSPVQQGWQPQQPQQPQQTYSAYTPSTQIRSPPPHEETMGFNHQADGTPPSASPQPYGNKATM